MDMNEIQANVILYLMLKSVEVIGEKDGELKEIVEDLEGIVQWNVGESKGYQVFGDGNYRFYMNEENINPKVKLKMSADTFKKIFSGEVKPTSSYMAGDITVEGDLAFMLSFASILEILMEYMEFIN